MTETTPLASCRDCGLAVSQDALSCPACGAPRPALQDWNGPGFEYRSPHTLFGLPLVHIAFGRDRSGRLRKATGIIAIGQFARGIVVIAQFGIGIVNISQFGLGAVGAFHVGVAAAGVGQFITALWGIGQFAVVGIWGRGQFVLHP